MKPTITIEPYWLWRSTAATGDFFSVGEGFYRVIGRDDSFVYGIKCNTEQEGKFRWDQIDNFYKPFLAYS